MPRLRSKFTINDLADNATCVDDGSPLTPTLTQYRYGSGDDCVTISDVPVQKCTECEMEWFPVPVAVDTYEQVIAEYRRLERHELASRVRRNLKLMKKGESSSPRLMKAGQESAMPPEDWVS